MVSDIARVPDALKSVVVVDLRLVVALALIIALDAARILESVLVDAAGSTLRNGVGHSLARRAAARRGGSDWPSGRLSHGGGNEGKAHRKHGSKVGSIHGCFQTTGPTVMTVEGVLA